MKPSEIVEILADIEDAWREMTPEKKRLYAHALSDLRAETTRTAVYGLIARLRFMPTVAEIREAERDERGVHPDVSIRYELGPGEQREMTPEERERWEAVKALLRERPVGRAYPKALDDLPDEVFRKLRFRLPANAMCEGVKGTGRRHGRHLLCDACGDDLDPDCVPVPPKERKCVAFRERADAVVKGR